MKKKIVVYLILLLAVLSVYLRILYKQNHQPLSQIEEIQNENTTSLPNITFSKKLNTSQWLYNAQDHVYYQLGIPYCSKPNAPDHQKLAIFVPERYLRCVINDDNQTYNCERNMAAIVGKYTIRNAPIVMPVEAHEYSSVKALTTYRNVSAYTNAGFVYVYTGYRGAEHGAPAGVADFKAAIRFIKANNGIIAGHTDRIFVFGADFGGGIAAIIGTSGDSPLYQPYLEEIGALSNVSDKIMGVMTWNPLTNFDTADIAYEWNMGIWRSNMNESQKKLSATMAKEYAKYINKAGFTINKNHTLLLQHSKDGLYQNGTYYDFVKEQIEKSLQTFIATTHFPYKLEKEIRISPQAIQKPEITLYGIYSSVDNYVAALNQKHKWIKNNTYWDTIEISSIADFVRALKPATKKICAFDSFERNNNLNMLFAAEDNKPRHFSSYVERILQATAKGQEYSQDLNARDRHGYSVRQRLNMYTPMYYLLPSSAGYRTSKVAPLWRIRSGIQQTETALTTEINLWLALQQYPDVSNTDFALVWDSNDEYAEEKDDAQTAFIRWVNNKFQ